MLTLLAASLPVDATARVQNFGAGGGGAYFGSAMDLDGDMMLAGAPGFDIGEDFNAGAAYLVSRNDQGEWNVGRRLVADHSHPYDLFGSSVALEGDLALVGATGDDNGGSCTGSSKGAVFVHQRSGNQWPLVQKLEAPDAHCGALYGYQMELEDGHLIVAGKQTSAGGISRGKLYAYDWNGASFDLVQQITDPNGANYDDFGTAIDLDGDRLAVGSPGDTSKPSGKVTLLERAGPGSPWAITHTITTTSGNDGDLFGHDVALDGDVLAIGSQGEETFGYWSGAVYMHRWDGSAWALEEKLFPVDGDNGDGNLFGLSVDVLGDAVIIGAPRDERGGAYNVGAAYLYQFDGSSWEGERLVRPDQGNNQNFGWEVTLDDEQLLVNAYTQGSGRVHVFDRDCPVAFTGFAEGCLLDALISDLLSSLPP